MLRRLLLLNFRLVYRVDQWFRQRLTAAGLLVLSALVAGAVFGIDVSETASHQLFALAAALLGISMVSALTFRARFSAARDLPRFATVGEAVVYPVRITNHSASTQRGLVAEERLRWRSPTYEDFVRSAEPRMRRRNLFDRYVGYPRWTWLLQQSKGASTTEAALPSLAGGESADVNVVLTPLRRGHVRLQGLCISRPDPFGLFKAARMTAEPESLLVLPKRYPVRWMEQQGLRHDRVGGTSAATSTGDSEEFTRVREYQPGDPLRHIHWRSWARLGQPIVKEFQDQNFLRQALVLDTFSQNPGARFEEAVSVAASFAGASSGLDADLDLMFVGNEAFRFTAGRGLAASDRLLEVLACVEVCRDRPFSTLVDLIGTHAHGLSACVCVLLEWDGQRQALVRMLRATGLPVLVLVVVDAGQSAVGDPGPMADQPDRLRVVEVDRAAESLAALTALSNRGSDAKH